MATVSVTKRDRTRMHLHSDTGKLLVTEPRSLTAEPLDYLTDAVDTLRRDAATGSSPAHRQETLLAMASS
jgi:hypothetical protein